MIKKKTETIDYGHTGYVQIAKSPVSIQGYPGSGVSHASPILRHAWFQIELPVLCIIEKNTI